MPDLDPRLADRATAEQVRGLDWLIRRVLIPCVLIDIACHAWSIYDRIFLIHPEQARSRAERKANTDAIAEVKKAADEEHVRINRLFDREERVEKAVFSR